MKFLANQIEYSIVDIAGSEFNVIDETGFVEVTVRDFNEFSSIVKFFCPNRGNTNIRYCERGWFSNPTSIGADAINTNIVRASTKQSPIDLNSYMEPGKMLSIVAAAVKYDNLVWALPRPARHHDVIRSIGGMSGPHIEGFVTSSGVFVNRTDAMNIAIAAGQLCRRQGEQFYQGPELYSEDLW